MEGRREKGNRRACKISQQMTKKCAQGYLGGLEEEVKDKWMENHFTPAPKRTSEKSAP